MIMTRKHIKRTGEPLLDYLYDESDSVNIDEAIREAEQHAQ